MNQLKVGARYKLASLLCLGLLACSGETIANPVPPTSAISPAALITSPTATQISSPTPTIAITAAPTSSEPAGCREPVDDYSRLEVNGHQLNQRTLEMLEYAYSLYGGTLDIRGPAITQGSYTNATEQSYGSHGGGGAVDLRVYDTSGERWVLLEDEIGPLIRALRLAGFAAWYRPSDYLSPGSPAHIHAIAIGDEFLSGQALTQLDGACGYFKGYAGWPIPTAECQAQSQPLPDIHGGPIVCDWMCELPYASLAESAHCQDLFRASD